MFAGLILLVGIGFFANTLAIWLGAKRMPLIQPEPGAIYIAESSAYSPTFDQNDDGPCITASTLRVARYRVANNDFPFGTILEVPGEPFGGQGKWYVNVGDRLNARYRRSGAEPGSRIHVDFWMPSTRQALQFGRREFPVKVVGYGEAAEHPDEVVKRLAQATPVEVEEDDQGWPLSLWAIAKQQTKHVKGLLRTAVGGDPDRFDLNCGAT